MPAVFEMKCEVEIFVGTNRTFRNLGHNIFGWHSVAPRMTYCRITVRPSGDESAVELLARCSLLIVLRVIIKTLM